MNHPCEYCSFASHSPVRIKNNHPHTAANAAKKTNAETVPELVLALLTFTASLISLVKNGLCVFLARLLVLLSDSTSKSVKIRVNLP